MRELPELRRDALEIFRHVLSQADAERAVLEAVELRGTRLRIVDAEFDLSEQPLRSYAVAFGKAAGAMASALDERLGGRIVGGVLSGPTANVSLPESWRVFEGGHPLPNEASLEAARAAVGLLREANKPSTHAAALVIFLVSGGGSAMLELPADPAVSLADLRETNRVLVSCGAGISEVNAVRRALSSVKGGRLAAQALLSAQLTLIVSDTPDGREADVASGPTFYHRGGDEADAYAVVKKYKLEARLPASVTRALEALRGARLYTADAHSTMRHFVLLDNARAREAAAEAARARGYAVEVASDISDQHVEAGARELVSRLRALRRREAGRAVCLVSGGEFACPVRGAGVGGRNSETALRCAFEFERFLAEDFSKGRGGREPRSSPANALALSAGTDGVDGNSPAAGALADHTTLRRARALGLSPEQFLAESDAYTLFDSLKDAAITGPTGTNVRDIRLLLME